MEIKDLEQRLISLERKFEKLEKDHQSYSTGDSVEAGAVKKISIKEFLIGKKVDDDVKLTLAIAYFLEHFGKELSFNVDDIKSGYRSAKIPLPSNVNDKINMNIKKGHIMDAKEKKDTKKAWEITATGENFVENELKK